MIPLFLVALDYYALRKDIGWNTEMCIIFGRQLVIRWYMVIVKTSHNNATIQHLEHSCEEYGKMKIDLESISEDEASNQGGWSNRGSRSKSVIS
ncbi:hypothetical protein H5410_017402 [Solanum commersonii]|uniref:Uncharacterized protein n=1 Tax=Solanum commersonii TaxID=4109 RepID=A0A9J5ZZW3_SOLCO|nr:hypothetical protein H5410_017402 [Solanum commersonii]